MSTVKSETGAIVNGLDTAVLSELAGSLADRPEAGRVGFRADSRWNGGAKVTTTVTGFAVDGQSLHEDDRRFVLEGDEPRELGATDSQACPMEQLMHAVANCVAATTGAYAALSGVRLSRLEVGLTGDVDLHGIFGLDEAVRPGLSGLGVEIRIAGDADEATLRGIAEKGARFSPIHDTVENGVTTETSIRVVN